MLKGKTAIVTGGTRGIGFAIVKKYLENGANVAIAGSRQESVEKAMEKLPEYEDRIMGIWPDICSPDEVAEAFASVKEKFGRIDILVNNAGIIKRQDSIEFSEDDWDSVINVNLKTVFFLTQAVAKQFLKQL